MIEPHTLDAHLRSTGNEQFSAQWEPFYMRVTTSVDETRAKRPVP